jgi:hypothetical protein
VHWSHRNLFSHGFSVQLLKFLLDLDHVNLTTRDARADQALIFGSEAGNCIVHGFGKLRGFASDAAN